MVQKAEKSAEDIRRRLFTKIHEVPEIKADGALIDVPLPVPRDATDGGPDWDVVLEVADPWKFHGPSARKVVLKAQERWKMKR